MSLTDWTMITDGTVTRSLTGTEPIFGTYLCRFVGTTSRNYVTYMYANASQYESLRDVKIDCVYRKPFDNSYYYANDATWTNLGSDYAANGSILTCINPVAGWETSARTNEIINPALPNTGFSFTWGQQQQFFIGFSTSTDRVAWTTLSHCITISGNIVRIYESNVQKFGINGTNANESVPVFPGDKLNIIINSGGYPVYQINGVTIWTSTTVLSSSSYIHFCGNSTDYNPTIDVKVNTATPSTISGSPLLFVRLQGTAQNSECYALVDQDGYYKIVKGNLNSNTLTAQTLVACAPTSTLRRPYKVSLEAVNVDSTTVKLTAKLYYYPFFENTMTIGTNGDDNVRKRISQANQGIMGYSYCVGTGKNGNALKFSGNEILSSYHYSSLTQFQPKALEFWFKAADTTKGTIVCRMPNAAKDAAGYNQDFKIQLQNNKLVTHQWIRANGSVWVSIDLTSTTTIVPNTWYHVYYTYSNSSSSPVKLFINGVWQAEAGAYGWHTATNNTFYIIWGACAYDYSWVYSDYYTGLIENFHITINPTVTESVVLDRYNAQLDGTAPVTDGNSVLLSTFNDSPTEVILGTYYDTNSPILTGGKVGVGMYSTNTRYALVDFDNVNIYTDV